MPARKEKVASLLQREVAQTLQREMSDPRLQSMISITHVKVSEDLRQAMVFVSVLPREHETRVIAALTDATRHIQAKTQSRVALRTMPRLQFRLDESLKKQADVLAAIRQATDRTAHAGDAAAGDESQPPNPMTEN